MTLAKVERKIEYFPILGGEIKTIDDAKGIVGGYLNYIGNIDYGADMTMKGAFRKTIKDSFARKSLQDLDFLWPYLWNHDYNQLPPGGIFDADETAKGLYTKTQFNLDIQSGRDLYSSFKAGFLRKQSMGYKAIQVEYAKDEKTGRTIRRLLEVAVMEGSAVVFPMNDMAQVDTVKNLNRRNFYMTGNKLLTKQDLPAITKDYAASYEAMTQQDWVSDLWNLWYPLRNEILQAFVTGDTPAEDVQKAIAQFSTAVAAYVQRGIELDMTEYLQPDDDDTGPMPGMYMSADDNPETKAGRSISDANHTALAKAADGISGHVKEIKSVLARARSAQLQGYPLTMSEDDPMPELKEEDAEPKTKEETYLDVHTILDDLASVLSTHNADRGV